MTTIATDGVTIAADGRRCCGSELVNDDAKKITIAHGRIYALTGLQPAFVPMIAWHNAGAVQADVPKFTKDDGFRLIVIDRDRTLRAFYQDGSTEEWPYPQAFGSGSGYALALLDAGFTAREAVAGAIKRDVYSGGSIQVINIAEALGQSPQPMAAE